MISCMKRWIYVGILWCCSLCFVWGQALNTPPKVVVGISVDGLNRDYLSLFWHELSQGGFKRLVSEGTTFDSFSYGYQSAGNAPDIATLQTGSLPYLHGIAGDNYFVRKSAKSIPVTTDPSAHSFGLDVAHSAHRLQASTLADQLNEDSQNRAQIVSIAINPTAATLQVGHSGLALWMDKQTGRWTTSSYYETALPSWAGKTADDYLNKRWEPLHLAALYYAAPRVRNKNFVYDLNQLCYGSAKYEQFATTPYANDMVVDLAMEAVQNYAIGKDLQTDMLLLQFSLQPLFTQQTDGLTLELEDAYLRLDKELEALFDFLDKRFGQKEVLVYLTGTRTLPHQKPHNEHVPSQSFCTYRYMALLNAYLMAHYGSYSWVQGSWNGHIYLDRQQIEQQGKDLRQVQQTAVNFFATIPGVMNVSTSFQLNEAFIGARQLHYAFHANSSGDLVFSLLPGWYEVDKYEKPTGFVSRYNTTTQLYLWGWHISVQQILQEVDATHFAPTLARWLRISQPNASKGGSLPILLP